MIWGVGTGRCGTRSLAVQLGGEHEPKPWLKHEAAYYARGLVDTHDPEWNELIHRLNDRRDHDTPIIVDLKHSYVMDLIEAVDLDAHFVVMFRNPFDCIASFMLGGAFTDQDWQGDRKLRTNDQQLFDSMTRLEKVTWFWVRTNIRILEHLEKSDRPRVYRRTGQLTVRENVYSKQAFRFTRKEASMISNQTHRICTVFSQKYNYTTGLPSFFTDLEGGF